MCNRNAFYNNSFLNRFIFSLFTLIILQSCSKEVPLGVVPQIALLPDSGCVYSDTTLPMGSILRFSIKAVSNASPITNFTVKYIFGNETYFLDTGVYTNDFAYSFSVQKGNAEVEEWLFSVMNKERLSASYRIKIFPDTGAVFGNIKEYSLILGAQNNSSYGPFYSFQSDAAYTLQEASLEQQLIDMNYYYHTEYESVLSSPNDNDAPLVFIGPNGIGNWHTRNESRYNLTSLTPSNFDAVQTDSTLIVSYDITGAKRKAKNISVGQIWAFKIQSGKIGLIRIDNVVQGDAGKVELSIKLQE